MAVRTSKRPDSAIARFIEAEVTGEVEHDEPSTQVISVRVEVQTVGDLEDLAGRLDLTRSMLARRLIEHGLEEAEEAWERLQQG